MISKEFLLIECKNLRSVLNETLGSNYGIDGIEAFFTEISTRLDFIEERILAISANKARDLQPYSLELIKTSALISRVERSCIGEYSWPFVTEFKKMAKAIWCTERISSDINSVETDEPLLTPSETKQDDGPPMMFVLSEGGLDSYTIRIEQKRASISRLLILTIQFPRSLKHFVLLHPILGHELGHALSKVSKFSSELRNIIDTLIASSDKLKTPEATRDWIFNVNQDAPEDYKKALVFHSKKINIKPENFATKVKLESWHEEILCDLIGLLIFGPSFLGALVTLLYSLDPSGLKVNEEHPIVCTRINLLLTASKILNYDNIKLKNPEFEATARKFWNHLEATKRADPWFDMFSEKDITAALDNLKTILGSNDVALYPAHTPEIIEPLVKQLSRLIPPVGYKVVSTSEETSFHVDFRHILYAGWLVSEHEVPHEENDKKLKKIDFNILNRLCEHGIMQQIAIDLG